MIGGELLGKLIVLSFRDDEDVLFSKTMSALASVADFSTATASAEAPILFGSLQIDPQRRLVRQAEMCIRDSPLSCPPLHTIQSIGRITPTAWFWRVKDWYRHSFYYYRQWDIWTSPQRIWLAPITCKVSGKNSHEAKNLRRSLGWRILLWW